ncbi:hypothetical protein QL996_15090, partial [Planococcus sp. APC 4015]|nr:hypothetical protein [Planococcus sp. APC 4015]
MPEIMTVVLNVRPEKSSNVPSWEKCRVHQRLSRVVRMARSTPKTRTTVEIVPRKCEEPGGEI